MDASPWGGGGALYVNDLPVEYWTTAWSADLAAELQVEIGQPSGQTTWEMMAIFYCLLLWGRSHRGHGLVLLGDNLAALESALNLRGKGALAKIGREVAWRRARDGWRYVAVHLPTKRNRVADALSRLAAPGREKKEWPTELAYANQRALPEHASLWTL